jgi:uncharacterized protein YndB with AHSA1/START domain
MFQQQSSTSADHRDLILTRVFNAPPARVYEAWTTPELVKKWFTPPPFETARVELDVRPAVRAPNGTESPNYGVYLELIENRKIVMTNAYKSAWEPTENPFMTVILTFDDLGDNQTGYTALVRHWTIPDREAHEQRGFHTGWPIAAQQLADLIESQPQIKEN